MDLWDDLVKIETNKDTHTQMQAFLCLRRLATINIIKFEKEVEGWYNLLIIYKLSLSF